MVTQPALEHQLEKNQELRKLLLAGNAIFSVKSVMTEAHRTFRIKRAPISKNATHEVYFVYMLTAADNTDNGTDWQYIGFLNMTTNSSFHAGKQTGNRIFNWFWFRVVRNTLPDNCEVYHAMQCMRCGRRLTTPESVKRGIGPVCAAL